jgi:hypothetical protein
MALVACSGAGDKGSASSSALIPTAAAAEHIHENRSADSSPLVLGAWKFMTPKDEPLHPKIDTEFRFINPTTESLTLEYAFFESNGTPCGCDRDDFIPNQTTEYTMLDERKLGSAMPGGPLVFSCHDPAGALKSIVFKHDGQHIFLDDAEQVGFQTHVFGDVKEADDQPLITGKVMTEAPLQGVAINDSTLKEIQAIHDECVKVNGLLQ